MKIRLILLWFAVGFLLPISISMAGEKSCDELIVEAERLWDINQFEASDKQLDQAIEMCPKLAAPYWRKGRNIYDRLEKIPRDQKPEKKELIKQYQEVEALADKCIERDENNAQCWLWKGVGIGRRGTTQGVLKSLFMASDVENAWLKAESIGLTYRSEDGTSDAKCGNSYAMGMLYRVLPEWLCHFPIKQIVGTCGDLKKSVAYQRKAFACAPNDIQINKELAVSLLCHGQKYDQPEEIEEAKKLLIGLQSLGEVRLFDSIDKEHAKMLLADISIACGYQRDKQQEQSKETYDNDNQ